MKKAFSRLRNLFQSERGHVIAIGAATLPLLMGSAGFAIDAAQMAMWKRQLQRAADSAAIAGAHALAQGAPTDPAVANDVDEHIDYDIGENETPMLKQNPTVTPGGFVGGAFSPQDCSALASPCWKAVQVSLLAERRLPFMGMFTRSVTPLTAIATAAVVPEGDFCLISLYDGADTGISTGGNSGLSLGCGMTTNARGSSNKPAFNVYGSGSVTADPVAAVGNIEGSFTSGTTKLPYSSPVEDPFADVPDPSVPPGESCNAPLTVPKDTEVTLDPASGSFTCYTSWTVTGTLKLKKGTYYVNNSTLTMASGGKLIGEDVTLVFMGDNSDYVENGQNVVSLSAPDDGDYAGIAIYRERDAATKTFKINGGANLSIEGAIYMASTDLWVLGNAGISSECLQIVTRKVDFNGGGTIDNECPDNTMRSITYNKVRLVA